MGLVCDEFGAPLARRLAARIPSTKETPLFNRVDIYPYIN